MAARGLEPEGKRDAGSTFMVATRRIKWRKR
jgi:hypothetical protein